MLFAADPKLFVDAMLDDDDVLTIDRMPLGRPR